MAEARFWVKYARNYDCFENQNMKILLFFYIIARKGGIILFIILKKKIKVSKSRLERKVKSDLILKSNKIDPILAII